MAILTGFPPSGSIAPGVRIAEKDLSFIVSEQSFHRAGLIGFASKGPINLPTLIRSTRQLNTIFGFPHPESSDPYMLYAAQAYLKVASELYIIRVAQEANVDFEQAVTASIDTPSAGGQIRIISNVAGPYVFGNDRFFRWKLNGVLSSKTLVILAGTYTTDELVEYLNDHLDPTGSGYDTGIEFFNSSGHIAVRTTFAYGPDSELEFVSVQDSAYGGDIVGSGGPNILGLGQGMLQAEVVGAADRYPYPYGTAGEFDFTGLTDLNLQIVVDGTDNIEVDNIVQVIDLADLEGVSSTSQQVVDAINDMKVENGGTLPGGWEAFLTGDNISFRTLHFGRDARIRVKTDSTALTIFGFTDETYLGVSPLGTTGAGSVYNYGRVKGAAASSGETSFTLLADSAGIDGNATQVVITNNIRDNTFSMAIYNNGVQVESWGGLTKDQTSRFYVEAYLAANSNFIRVQDNLDNPAPPKNGTYQLSGGTDGIPSDPDIQDALLIGNEIGFTGLYGLSDPEQYDIDLIAIPGHSSTSVVLAMLDFCQNKRQDCLAIIDPPFGLSVNEVNSWQNGTHPLNTTRFDSDFGAMYWPWVKIRDNYNRIDIWAPPSGSVMAMIARSDQINAPWYAPAGETRGILPDVNDVFSRPTRDDMDLLYGERNVVNCIVQFPDVQGFLVWGQKTLQRRPTALDRINVRRMLFVAEKRIRRSGRSILFEPHDDELRARFIRIASGILEEIKIGRGLYDYRVQCDTELNTNDVIDRNEMRARIGVQPERAAEFLFIEFSVHRTGTFAETADSF